MWRKRSGIAWSWPTRAPRSRTRSASRRWRSSRRGQKRRSRHCASGRARRSRLAALKSPAGYIGAIGSRTTNEKRVAWLRAQGVPDRDVARVHAPIGLDIGASGVEEIALAILAEIVAVRRHRSGRSLSAESVVVAR
ncbi:MAG: hypothetical protein E6I66_12135 [Chloroflexi bacterium]|nr:MAG: hypothetical protein E6I66_12135 [Chloroflexota bacterium]